MNFSKEELLRRLANGESIETIAQEVTEVLNEVAAEQEAAKMKEQFEQDKAEAEELARKLSSEQILIRTKTGEGGRLFGSITSMDIAEAIKEQTGIEVDRRKIELEKPIKETGISEVELKLFQDVTAKVGVKVEGSKED
jgi:large subunit ribosomal protein L9